MERARLPNPLIHVGRIFTEWLIDRSLRQHFRAVYVRGEQLLDAQRGWVLYANHHYWWDGYLCYALVRNLERRPIAWMRASRRFPPFHLLGALPFPPNDPAQRTRTIRQTLRWLQAEKRILFLFPEGHLHPDTHRLLPFERSLAWLAKKLPNIGIAPLAITIEPSYHQYPCAYLTVGNSLPKAWHALPEAELTGRAQQYLHDVLMEQHRQVKALITSEQARALGYQVLIWGKLSAHERYSQEVGDAP